MEHDAIGARIVSAVGEAGARELLARLLALNAERASESVVVEL